MNWFRIRQYLWYRKHAKGRHGLHSPMVYQFLDKGLRKRQTVSLPAYRSYSDKVYYPAGLIHRIIAHFQFKRILVSGCEDGKMEDYHPINQNTALIEGQMDYLYDWTKLLPEEWTEAYQHHAAALKGAQVVMLRDIHLSPAHLNAWNDLCSKKDVRLSIDLFEIGLLFFSEDFKERQHFVLKLPHNLQGRQIDHR